MTAMTPDKVEAALGVQEALAILRNISSVREWWLADWKDGGGNDSPNSALSNFTDATARLGDALATLTSALAERERDAARYRRLRNDPPLELCVRARNAFGESAYTDGADLDTAIDAAMKDTDHAR